MTLTTKCYKCHKDQGFLDFEGRCYACEEIFLNSWGKDK